MGDGVKEKLRELINTQGQHILHYPNKFTSLMLDLCLGTNEREINILATALIKRIPQQLQASESNSLTEELISILSHRLENETGLRADAANWAVYTWAEALGMVTWAYSEINDNEKQRIPPKLEDTNGARLLNPHSFEASGIINFSKIELRDLSICWLVLSFCFSLQYLIPSQEIPYSQSLARFPVYFGVALIGIGAGFLFHELAHKGMAQHFGYHAEFRMWKLGLIIAAASALITFGHFLFFAPGSVYTSTYKTPDPREEGFISGAGPVTNIALAGLFYLLAAGTGYADSWSVIGAFGFQVNLWLAAMTLLPFPQLDGIKILRWNKAAWLALAVLSWGLLLLLMFGLIK